MRVLIVDDQEINRIVPRTHLERLGVSAAEAEDGRTALDLLAAGGFDTVLLDLGMPGLSGLDVCRRVRADPALRGVRLIAYTAPGPAQPADEIMAAGFDGLLAKPVRRDALIRALGLDGAPPG